MPVTPGHRNSAARDARYGLITTINSNQVLDSKRALETTSVPWTFPLQTTEVPLSITLAPSPLG